MTVSSVVRVSTVRMGVVYERGSAAFDGSAAFGGSAAVDGSAAVRQCGGSAAL